MLHICHPERTQWVEGSAMEQAPPNLDSSDISTHFSFLFSHPLIAFPVEGHPQQYHKTHNKQVYYNYIFCWTMPCQTLFCGSFDSLRSLRMTEGNGGSGWQCDMQQSSETYPYTQKVYGYLKKSAPIPVGGRFGCWNLFDFLWKRNKLFHEVLRI